MSELDVQWLQLKVETMMKEYEMLRTHILSNSNARFALVGYLLALIAFVGGQSDYSSTLRLAVSASGSMAVLAIWWRFGQLIGRAANQLEKIELRINGLLNDDLLSWETRISKKALFRKVFR